MRTGRPTKYSVELDKRICEWLTSGKSLRSLCEKDDIPDLSCIMSWLVDGKHKDFQEHYEQARTAQTEMMAEEIMEIAEELPEYNTKDGSKIDSAGIQRNQLRVDTRKWVMARMNRKRFGDRVDSTINVNVDISNEMREAEERLKKAK